MDSMLKTGTLFGVGHYLRLGHYSNNYGNYFVIPQILSYYNYKLLLQSIHHCERTLVIELITNTHTRCDVILTGV